MAGELWRSQFQIGKETTAGTAVAATRKMYFNIDGSSFSREREARPHRFATGTRDNVRAFTLGPVTAAGTVTMPLSASEIIELLLTGIKGNVSPTTPGGTLPRLWTFTPGDALDAATMEWQDGARQWQAAGCHVNTLRFSGSANGAATVTADIFARDLVSNALTTSLTDRLPDFVEGWETKIYVDALGGTAGTTQVTGTLINWEVEIQNQLGRKYFANNTNATGGVTIGELEVGARLTFEAAAAQAATEFSNWGSATGRLVRLEFGSNDVIESTYNKFVTIDLPGYWESFNLGGTDEGTRVYELSLQYAYDPTNAYGVQIRAQNARSAAW